MTEWTPQGEKYVNTSGNPFLCHREPPKRCLFHTEPTISERLTGLKRLSTDPQALKKEKKNLSVKMTERLNSHARSKLRSVIRLR